MVALQLDLVQNAAEFHATHTHIHGPFALPNRETTSVVRDHAYPQTVDTPSAASPLLEIK